MVRRLLVLVLSLVALRARAQTIPRGISLADARAAAVRLGPEVLLAEQREAVARAQVEVAGTLANPTLTLQSARLTARLSAGVSVPVPLFGQRSTAVAASRADAESVRLDTTVLRVEARWSATRAWLDLWEAQERARTTELAAGEAERLASIAEQRFAGRLGATPGHKEHGRRIARRSRADASGHGVRVAAAKSARLFQWLVGAGGSHDPPARRARPALGRSAFEPAALACGCARAPGPRARSGRRGAAAAARVRAEQRLRWPDRERAASRSTMSDPTLTGHGRHRGPRRSTRPCSSLRGGAVDRAQRRADARGRRRPTPTRGAWARCSPTRTSKPGAPS